MVPNKMNEEVENSHPKEGIQVADVAREKRTCIAKVYNPNAGDLIGGYKLVGQLDVVSAEADLWIAEHGGQEFVCKLYRHGLTSSLVSSGALIALDHPHLLPTKITGDHIGRQYEIVPFYSASLACHQSNISALTKPAQACLTPPFISSPGFGNPPAGVPDI